MNFTNRDAPSQEQPPHVHDPAVQHAGVFRAAGHVVEGVTAAIDRRAAQISRHLGMGGIGLRRRAPAAASGDEALGGHSPAMAVFDQHPLGVTDRGGVAVFGREPPEVARSARGDEPALVAIVEARVPDHGEVAQRHFRAADHLDAGVFSVANVEQRVDRAGPFDGDTRGVPHAEPTG